MKVYPNQIRQFYANLANEDKTAQDLLKLRSVTLRKHGQVYKQLNAKFGDGTWETNVIFDKKDEEGDYELHWDFTFDGDPVEPRVDYLTLHKKIDIITRSTESKSKGIPTDLDMDDTLPQDVKDMLEGSEY